MKFNIPINYIENLSKDDKWKDIQAVVKMTKIMVENQRYSSTADIVEVDEKLLDDNLAKQLQELAMDLKGAGYMTLKRQLESWLLVKENPESAVVKDLKVLPAAVEKFMLATCQFKYVFKKNEEGFFMPYLMTKIEYCKAYESYGTYHPACVKVNCIAAKNGKEVSTGLTVYGRDLSGGKTIKEIFQKEGWYIETEKLLTDYDKQFKNFIKWRTEIGKQFLGIGKAEISNSRGWGSRLTSLVVDGVKTKLVVDTDEDTEFKRRFTQTCWRDAKVDEGEEDDSRRLIPDHPYLQMYDLINHREVTVHAENLEEYVYKPELKEQLILPEEHIGLIDVLSSSSAEMLEDIIEGKTGGIIVACTGAPGTGKTLTAEVYSEVVGKPLYIVQSSQLGVTAVELEAELKKVLRRSQRWGAILLIDEADVYIHQRGSDIVQNAVVGVFLRVLEYYNGILFMTSNRRDIIDDAIKSRCTAEIEYQLPDENQKRVICSNLLKQFGLETALHKEKFLTQFVSTFTSVSGRDIKALLKLAGLLCKRKNEPLTIEILEFVSKFKSINKSEQ